MKALQLIAAVAVAISVLACASYVDWQERKGDEALRAKGCAPLKSKALLPGLEFKAVWQCADGTTVTR